MSLFGVLWAIAITLVYIGILEDIVGNHILRYIIIPLLPLIYCIIYIIYSGEATFNYFIQLSFVVLIVGTLLSIINYRLNYKSMKVIGK